MSPQGPKSGGTPRPRGDTYDRFADAERRYFARYGMEFRERFLELLDPPLEARVVETGQGPPVLMLHGGGGALTQWAPLMAEIGGFRMIAVDRPGCGLSSGFEYRGVDLRRHAEAFVASVLDGLELERVPIVANSMGGLWALWFALRSPERVTRLVLLGCPALILETSAPAPMRLLSLRGLNALMVRMQRPGPKAMRGTFKMMGHSEDSLDRQPPEFWESGALMSALPTYWPGFLTLIENVLTVRRARFNLGEDELRRVQQPTLFVWGERDAFGGPQYGTRAAELMPGASLQTVPAGHLPWLDEPAECGRLVGTFLRAAD
ncbi:MAG TPA: alpha/beta hydrolase [Actinomycetota bacterium]|nr:alpha/beta hydrolase [Actinomycetota bacterium]